MGVRPIPQQSIATVIRRGKEHEENPLRANGRRKLPVTTWAFTCFSMERPSQGIPVNDMTPFREIPAAMQQPEQDQCSPFFIPEESATTFGE